MNPRAVLIMWWLTIIFVAVCLTAPSYIWGMAAVISAYSVYAYIPSRRRR